MIYPKPYSIYLRGTICFQAQKPRPSDSSEQLAGAIALAKARFPMSCSLNSLEDGYVGEYIGGYDGFLWGTIDYLGFGDEGSGFRISTPSRELYRGLDKGAISVTKGDHEFGLELAWLLVLAAGICRAPLLGVNGGM